MQNKREKLISILEVINGLSKVLVLPYVLLIPFYSYLPLVIKILLLIVVSLSLLSFGLYKLYFDKTFKSRAFRNISKALKYKNRLVTASLIVILCLLFELFPLSYIAYILINIVVGVCLFYIMAEINSNKLPILDADAPPLGVYFGVLGMLYLFGGIGMFLNKHSMPKGIWLGLDVVGILLQFILLIYIGKSIDEKKYTKNN